VDRTLYDFLNQPNRPFGGLTVLFSALYSLLLAQDQQLSDRYFLDQTILSARNVEVDELNASILSSVAPQQIDTYLSADSVTDPKYDYISPEIIHTFSPSRFPLHKLKLKNGAPLMLLRNLDPLHGLYNETWLRLLRSTRQILECRVLNEKCGVHSWNDP
jgi:hypothetical protein